MIQDAAQALLLLVGSLFILISAIGILRMPDLFLRLQATSKASVLGLVCIAMAVAFHFDDTVVTIRAAVIISFLVLTIPVATHMLARAGYTTNVPISKETVINELTGHYDPGTHKLSGDDPLEWEIEIAPDAAVVGKNVAELPLPPDVLIHEITRGNERVVPRGPTTILAGDYLRVIARPDQLAAVRKLMEAPAAEEKSAGA